MKEKLIIWSGFNRGKFASIHKDKTKPHPTLTEEWILPRFEIWKRYCWKSLVNQTWDDFIYLVCCNPETSDIIEPLFNSIKDPRIIIDYSQEEDIKRISDIGKKYKDVVTLRLDSDDMYHPLAAEMVMIDDSDSEWLIFKNGYGIRTSGDKIHFWEYDVIHSGPFFAHRYKNHDFAKKTVMNEVPHCVVYNYNPVILKDGMFMVNVTGMNSSTTVGIRNFGRKIRDIEKINILNEFKIDFPGIQL